MPELAFERAELDARLAAFRAALRRDGLQGALVTSGESIYYLTGFRTTAFWALVTVVVPLEGPLAVVLRDFDHPNVAHLSIIDEAHAYDDDSEPMPLVARVLERRGLARARLGIEKQSYWLTVRYWEHLCELLPGAQFADVFHVLARMRQIKSPAEIAWTRQAAAIVSDAMRAGLQRIGEGVRETDVALEVQRVLAERGSEIVASPLFISGGKRSSVPHATAAPAPLEAGDLVSLEFGASVKRYHATQVRTAVVGRPSPELRRAADATIEAFARAFATIRPGVPFPEADGAARQVFAKAGLLESFRHRIAYTIGAGFSPTWGSRVGGDVNYLNATPRSVGVFEPGMVFHLIPLLIVPQLGAVGFSETVLVTSSGAEVLTDTPRELVSR